MPSHSIGTNRTIGTNGRTESSCTQTEPYLNEMQFTNGVPMECQVILLVPIVPLVPMDERNPTVLKQNHALMRCNSPMVYQWNAKSLYWYQSYHWYQWRAESSCTQTEPYLNEMQFTNGMPSHSIGTNRTIGTNGRTESSCTQTELYLNEMQFTNGVPMECQVTLLVPIVPLVPMDERNPTVLKQNHTLMRCNSPIVHQWNAKSLYWYQSYHWYQWTSGIQLYSNRTIPKIA